MRAKAGFMDECTIVAVNNSRETRDENRARRGKFIIYWVWICGCAKGIANLDAGVASVVVYRPHQSWINTRQDMYPTRDTNCAYLHFSYTLLKNRLWYTFDDVRRRNIPLEVTALTYDASSNFAVFNSNTKYWIYFFTVVSLSYQKRVEIV